MDFKDYYKILGVATDADLKAVKTAYRKLARKFHPDVSSETDAAERFKEVAEAYEVLAWQAICPAKNAIAWSIQLVSVAAILLGIGLAALWTLPPFWTPYVYALLFALISVRQLTHRVSPGNTSGTASVVNLWVISVVAVFGVVGAYLAYHAEQGRVLPNETVVDISPPFAPGSYLVAHGGSTQMVNVHLATLDASVERFLPWRGQSKALDIFRITPMGFHKDGWLPTDPARYETFAVPVTAPCTGEVALVVDGLADMQVPVMDPDNRAGNFVAVDCGEFFVILAHLRLGSIVVAAGDAIEAGDPLGEMGNSGNSSEPHLHLHAQRGLPADAPLGGEQLWLTLNGQFPVRNERIIVE